MLKYTTTGNTAAGKESKAYKPKDTNWTVFCTAIHICKDLWLDISQHLGKSKLLRSGPQKPSKGGLQFYLIRFDDDVGIVLTSHLCSMDVLLCRHPNHQQTTRDATGPQIVASRFTDFCHFLSDSDISDIQFKRIIFEGTSCMLVWEACK